MHDARFRLPVPTPAEAAHHVAVARDALRHAQVELYCDHDGQALAAVRLARREAALAGSDRGVRLEIEEAAWHVRRHEMRQALLWLDSARRHLG